MFETLLTSHPIYQGHTGINIEGWNGEYTKTSGVQEIGTDFHFSKTSTTSAIRIPDQGTLQIGDNSVDISIGITFTYKQLPDLSNRYAIPWSKGRQGADPFGLQSVLTSDGYFRIQNETQGTWILKRIYPGQRTTIDAVRRDGVFDLYFNGRYMDKFTLPSNFIMNHDWVIGSYLGFQNELLTSDIATPTEWILHGFEVKSI